MSKQMTRQTVNKSLRCSYFTRTDRIGYLYVLPFLLGFIFLFARPMVNSIIYSFHRITFGNEGMTMTPIGWENYRYALFGDAEFFKELLTLGGDLIIKIAVTMFLSMFLGVMLNEKFKGRLFFRTVLFLPVIFGADAIMELFANSSGQESSMMANLNSETNAFLTVNGQTTGFIKELIGNFGFLSGIMEKFAAYTDELFSITWEIGIQVVLFIVGLQSVPSYLYEVCDMEGATAWERFWKITFPLLSPTIMLVLIYTLIDNLNSRNKIMLMIHENLSARIDYACAQAWLYTLLGFLLVMAIYFIMNKRTIYLD